MKSIGERIKYLRISKGINQEELGKKLGLVKSTISMYENNKSTPDADMLTRLADYFGVSIDYLLGRTNIKSFTDPTVALHREDGYDDDLPDEARKEIEEFKKFIRHKYGKK